MPLFNYTALDKTDSFVRGQLEAKSSKRAIATLEGEGFMIINITEEKRTRYSKLNNIFNNVTRVDKIFFTRHLYTMLESGIALDQAVKITAEQTTQEKFKVVLFDIHQQLLQGRSFHECLNRHKRYFDNFYISMVRVGEKSGKLDEVLSYLLEQQESDYEVITKSRSAMIYPSVIISALVVMVTFMMLFVIPKITEILTEYEVTLPLATRVLIGLSGFLSNYGLYLIPVLGVIVYLFLKWKKSPRGKWRWDGLILKLPGIKKIVIEFNLARFTRSLSSLLKSGMQLDQALELAAEVSNNSHYQKSLRASINFVQKGIPLVEVLKGNTVLFPQITTRMIEVGEKTGKLDHMLQRLAVFYEKALTTTIANISSIIEPALLITIGLAVAFVAIAVLTPVWSYSQTV
ncbi:MAG: type II secretion system F family protein [Patescibacteria group bacterium]|nr:type II secretion system F family protein [Patescibacteria group bacterium]MDD5715243.1 type II secretion system F family protein [Patescibacteria group bacterium]